MKPDLSNNEDHHSPNDQRLTFSIDNLLKLINTFKKSFPEGIRETIATELSTFREQTNPILPESVRKLRLQLINAGGVNTMSQACIKNLQYLEHLATPEEVAMKINSEKREEAKKIASFISQNQYLNRHIAEVVLYGSVSENIAISDSDTDLALVLTDCSSESLQNDNVLVLKDLVANETKRLLTQSSVVQTPLIPDLYNPDSSSKFPPTGPYIHFRVVDSKDLSIASQTGIDQGIVDGDWLWKNNT